MKPILMQPEYGVEQDKMDDIQQSLDIIEHKLVSEITAKQRTIDFQEQEIQRLHKLSEEKNELILQINEKLGECARNSEGNRQLINKLLNDIERLNQDVEWYKKTYEQRSLLGMIKQKVFRS